MLYIFCGRLGHKKNFCPSPSTPVSSISNTMHTPLPNEPSTSHPNHTTIQEQHKQPNTDTNKWQTIIFPSKNRSTAKLPATRKVQLNKLITGGAGPTGRSPNPNLSHAANHIPIKISLTNKIIPTASANHPKFFNEITLQFLNNPEPRDQTASTTGQD